MSCSVQLYYKLNTEPKKPFRIPDISISLNELKSIISQQTGLPFSSLRLVKAGKILQGEDRSLVELGIQAEDTLHVAKLASNTAAQDAANAASQGFLGNEPAGSSDMDSFLDNPFLQGLLSNPELMSAMLEADPRISQMAEVNQVFFI
jgi:hypothetical protein